MKNDEQLFRKISEKLRRWDSIIEDDILRCPLCWKTFGPDSLGTDLSVEHVPPKAAAREVGEKTLKTLSCRNCNNSYGTRYQKDLTNFLKSQLHLHGKYDKDIDGSIKVPGIEVPLRSRIACTPDKIAVRGVPRANSPATVQQHVSAWNEVAKNHATDWSFTVTLNYGYRPQLAWLGYLEAAYLAAYILTDYTYGFSKVGAQLRELITGGHSEQIGPCVIVPPIVGVGGQPWIARVAKPDNLQCLWVKVAGNIVILPLPTDDDLSCYSAWQQGSEQRNSALVPRKANFSLSFFNAGSLAEAQKCLLMFR